MRQGRSFALLRSAQIWTEDLQRFKAGWRGRPYHSIGVIYRRFRHGPLFVCLSRGAHTRVIAFITDACTIQDILLYLGEPTRTSPYRTRPQSASLGGHRR